MGELEKPLEWVAHGGVRSPPREEGGGRALQEEQAAEQRCDSAGLLVQHTEDT